MLPGAGMGAQLGLDHDGNFVLFWADMQTGQSIVLLITTRARGKNYKTARLSGREISSLPG